jgi:hypothetical protein
MMRILFAYHMGNGTRLRLDGGRKRHPCDHMKTVVSRAQAMHIHTKSIQFFYLSLHAQYTLYPPPPSAVQRSLNQKEQGAVVPRERTFSCQPNRTLPLTSPQPGIPIPLYKYFISVSCVSCDNDLTTAVMSADLVLLRMVTNVCSVTFCRVVRHELQAFLLRCKKYLGLVHVWSIGCIFKSDIDGARDICPVQTPSAQLVRIGSTLTWQVNSSPLLLSVWLRQGLD